MALKLNQTATEHAALSEALKALYKKNDDGSFTLEVEGAEDTGALKRAKEHEKEQRKLAEKSAKELQTQIEALNTQLQELRDAPPGDKKKTSEADALNKSWETKMAKREKELTTQIEAAQKALQTHLVDSVASQMAATLAGESAPVLIPHIKSRLQAEIVDGKAITKVLGADGMPSALTVEDLQKEFLSSATFAPIVIGSKGSGSGANGERKGGGGGAPKKLSEMSATEEAHFANKNPAEYQRMIAAEGAPKKS